MASRYDAGELFRMDGKVAVITGATRGLGLEMARAHAAQGASVVVCSRKPEACERVAEDLSATYAVPTLAAPCNVSDWEQCDELVARAYDAFGQVDILVNNAGLSPVYDSLASVTEALFDKVVGVNLKGPFRLSALVGERMSNGEGGSILNISSSAATEPDPASLPYAAAKAGLNTMTVGLARAYGPRVRVNAILAGPFLTDISKAWDLAAFEAQAERSMSLGRGGMPHEIVGAALLLTSSAGSFCTGALLALDGGYADLARAHRASD